MYGSASGSGGRPTTPGPEITRLSSTSPTVAGTSSWPTTTRPSRTASGVPTDCPMELTGTSIRTLPSSTSRTSTDPFRTDRSPSIPDST